MLTTKPGKCIWYWFLLINVKNATYLENSVLIGYRFEQIKKSNSKNSFPSLGGFLSENMKAQGEALIAKHI